MSTKELCKVGRQVSRKTKLKAGLHEFKFVIPLFPNLPGSVSPQSKEHVTRGFAIEFDFQAHTKLGKSVLEARVPVEVRRMHATSGQPFTVPLRGASACPRVTLTLTLPRAVKNSRPDTLRYEIAVPHSAWAAGTTIRARLSLYVLDSRIKMDSLSCALVQTVSAMCGKGHVNFATDLATVSGLSAGDSVVELAIPENILTSYDNADRGVKIEHTLNVLARFVDQNARAGELKSAVPLT